jgi:hypothetical protein
MTTTPRVIFPAVTVNRFWLRGQPGANATGSRLVAAARHRFTLFGVNLSRFGFAQEP